MFNELVYVVVTVLLLSAVFGMISCGKSRWRLVFGIAGSLAAVGISMALIDVGKLENLFCASEFGVDFLSRSDRITGLNWWMVLIGWSGYALTVWLIFFNCRNLTRGVWRVIFCGIGMTLLTGAGAILFFYGLRAWWIFLGSEAELMGMSQDGVMRFFVFGMLLLLVAIGWTWMNFRKKRHGGKTAIAAGAGFAAIGCGIFLITIGAMYWFCSVMLVRTASFEKTYPPIPAEYVKRVEAYLAKRENDVGLKLNFPFEGIKYWTPREEKPEAALKAQPLGAGNMISPEERQTVLAFFQSPEGKTFFEDNAAAAKMYAEYYWQGRSEDIGGVLPGLNITRSIGRRAAAQAALLYELKRYDEVLPALESTVVLEEAIVQNQELLIEKLVLIAIESIRLSALVQFGPDGTAYAPYYREQLEQFLNRPIQIPSEIAFLRKNLKLVMAMNKPFWGRNESSESWEQILYYPSRMALHGRYLQIGEMIPSELAKYYQCEVVPKGDKNSVSNIWMLALLRQKINLALRGTALALKCYRSENGSYPEKLSQLVPGFLGKLPKDPGNGEELSYQLLPDGHFKLALPSNPIMKATSIPAY